jgi:hypothetical protein
MWRYQQLIGILLIILGFTASGFGQNITTTTNGAIVITLPFGMLTPGTSTTPDSQTVQFRIRNNNATGYHVRVTSATFTPTTTDPVSGGETITASDLGVGIVSVVPSPTFSGILPRSDVITAGFDYDPGAIAGVNGLTPYGGLAGSPSRATVQDLISTPNIKILIGNQIHTSQSTGSASNYLLVTMRFALLRQYFTPATFTGTITLRIANGP